MASDFDARLQYALKNAPGGKNGLSPLHAFMWAFGAPVQVGGQNLDELFYMNAVRQGQNPSSAMPWLNGGDSSGGASTAAKNPIAGMPQWYQDWYNSQGKFGGVPPVQGLL